MMTSKLGRLREAVTRYLRKMILKPGMVVHTVISATWDAEAGELQVLNWSRQLSEDLVLRYKIKRPGDTAKCKAQASTSSTKKKEGKKR